MEQKTTWMRYLPLGISIIILLTFFQCKKRIDYIQKGTFVYTNGTTSIIELKRGVYTFLINPNEAFTIPTVGDGGKNINPSDYSPPFQGNEILIYDNIYCDTLLIPKEGILSIENYTNEKVEERHYKFTYTFTEADYNKGVPCN